MNKILLIIPTLNAQQSLRTLLHKLQNQTHHVDILVIDSSSSDKTIDIAKECKVDVVNIKKENFNHATTRNFAINYEVDFYLFMTQDALPHDDKLVENLLKPFDDRDVVVSYARQIPYDSADEIEKFARETNYPDISMTKSKKTLSKLGIKTFFCSNSCAMYRASYFQKVKGFRDALVTNEDMEFCARAILDDKKIAYVSRAKVWHSHTYTIGELYRRYFDIGRFFSENRWILDEVKKYSKIESTGIKQVANELKYLLKHKKLLIPKSLIFSLVKFVAYKKGNPR